MSFLRHRKTTNIMSYCYRCERYFVHEVALGQHMRESSLHNYCDVCAKDFPSENALRQHFIQSSQHAYCQYCDRHFSSDNGLYNHCSAVHFYCFPCHRLFQSESSLQAHLSSSVHTPRNFKCPAQACGRLFVSVSALIMHAETGTCPSGVTRRQVNEFVARLDRRNAITNTARMLPGPDGSWQVPSEVVYWATERSWNGRAYECFLCSSEFTTLQSLDAHLKSPRHQAPLYHCPLRSCAREFVPLSALSQHVENGSCGVRNLSQVRKLLNQMPNNMRMIAL